MSFSDLGMANDLKRLHRQARRAAKMETISKAVHNSVFMRTPTARRATAAGIGAAAAVEVIHHHHMHKSSNARGSY